MESLICPSGGSSSYNSAPYSKVLYNQTKDSTTFKIVLGDTKAPNTIFCLCLISMSTQ
jgi:hypothetical protein